MYALCLATYADSRRIVPNPAWPETFLVDQSERSFSSDIRYTFELPKRHPFCLVEVPSRLPDGAYPEHFAVHFNDKWLNARLVHANEEKTTLLIDATPALGGDTIEIYPLGHSDEPPADDPRPSSDSGSPDFWIVRAPQPIAVEFRRGRLASEDIVPDILTSAQAGILRRSRPDRFMARDLAAASALVRNARHERRGSPFNDGVTDLHTWVYVDRPGTYLFAIRGRGASLLTLGPDEHPVAVSFHPFPASRRPDDSAQIPPWSLGAELHLEPGAYCLHLANYYLYDPNLSIGWLRPGAEDIAEISPADLLTGQETLPPIRIEPRDAGVVASVRTQLSAPYTFVGHSNLFATCTATPNIVSWAEPRGDDAPPSYDWTLDGNPVSDERILYAVLSDGAHELVFHTTQSGYDATVTNIVHVHGLPQHEYRVAASLNDIPSLLRETDILRPDLWITGDFSAPLAVNATLDVHLRDGTVRSYASRVSPIRNWARLEGEALPVSEAESVSWTVRHGSILLASGTLMLQRPPFSTAPASLDGDTLRAPDGTTLAYVLPSAEKTQPPPVKTAGLGSAKAEPADVSDAPLLLLTDILLSPAADTNELALLASAFGPDIRAMRPSALRGDACESLARLAPLAGLDAIPEGSTVILAIGLDAILDRTPVEDYERRLLAIALLLRDTRHARVIVTTPPPFEDTPVPVRPYATAALRAAALAGLPAADLYSAFQTLRSEVPYPLLSDLRLTREGLQRAAETLFHALP